MTRITQIKIYRSAFVPFVSFVDPFVLIRAIRGPIRGPHSWMSKVE
jgi:hypothetical protein